MNPESLPSRRLRIAVAPLTAGLIGFLGLAANVAHAQNYAIDWYTFDGGGGASMGGVYSFNGTIGQPDAGMHSGGPYGLGGGFWSPGDGDGASFVMPFTAVVVNTNSTGSGSLAAAIDAANASVAPVVHVHFDIPGPGLHSIAPGGALPALTRSMSIDGTTQPGFAGQPVIEINGADAGNAFGLHLLNATGCVVRGLVINRFQTNGIMIATGCCHVIEGNYIGTDPSGTVALGNAHAVGLYQSASNRVGGLTVAARNLLSGNRNSGVRLRYPGTRGNRILGNFIGTDVTGANPLANAGEGIFITDGASTNELGSVEPGGGNTIMFNGGAGILAGRTGEQGQNRSLTIRGNSIFSNTDLGIDLQNNGNINFRAPDLGFVTNSGATVAVAVTLLGGSGPFVRVVDFYGVPQCDSSLTGEGQVYVGSVTNLAGFPSPTNITLNAVLPLDWFLTATATDLEGNTSRFSDCLPANNPSLPVSFAVLNTNAAGLDSLLNALNNAAASASTNVTITFAIPGAGPFLIQVDLPSVRHSVSIDGTTQPGYAGMPLVELRSRPFGATDGLRLNGSDSVVRGLAINGFPGYGVFLNGVGNRVEGNFIGVDTTGTNALPNLWGVGIASAHATIGGVGAALRNVIVATNAGIRLGINARDSRIKGNFIGVDVSGLKSLGGGIGVEFLGNFSLGVSNNIIGGTGAGEGNLIRGLSGHGILAIGLDGVRGTRVLGNQIVSNGGDGIRISATSGTTNNALLSNSIYGNGGLAIDLGGNGVTPNDPGDVDAGPNGLQNFPVLAAVTNTATNTLVAGTLHSRSDAAYFLDFYASLAPDESGHGEAQLHLGRLEVMTDANGDAVFLADLPPAEALPCVTATATDVDGNTSEFSFFRRDMRFTDCSGLAIQQAGLPSAPRDSAYSLLFTAANGALPHIFSLAAGALPAGLSLSSTGLLSGTLTSPIGDYAFTIRLTDGRGCTVSSNYTLTVTCPLIGIGASAAGPPVINQSYSQSYTASGGTAPYTFAIAAGVLPPGLSLTASGVLSGIPTALGTFDFTVSAVDAEGCVGTSNVLLRVQPFAILQQPMNVVVRIRPDPQSAPTTNAIFTVFATTPNPPLSYQWRFNGTNIPGAAAMDYTVSNVTLADEGDYSCVLTDTTGSVYSGVARLTPWITPYVTSGAIVSHLVLTGAQVTFSVTYEGHPLPFRYEWRRGSSPILVRTSNLRSDFITFNVTNILVTNQIYRTFVNNVAYPVPLGSGSSVATNWVTTVIDTDADGLPDYWESGFNVTDPTGDADSDGMSNVDEYNAGTDPTDPASLLKVTDFTLEPGETSFQFLAVSNRTYGVQASFTLEPGSWLTLTNVSAGTTNRTVSLTLPTAPPPRYLRLITPGQL